MKKETQREMTFAGYPVTMELIDDEVYVTCKTVTGSLEQGHAFLNGSKNKTYYFGDSKIVNTTNKKVKIDCLEDTKEQFIYIYKQAKQFKDEYGNSEI
jgi:hypothetical protein